MYTDPIACYRADAVAEVRIRILSAIPVTVR